MALSHGQCNPVGAAREITCTLYVPEFQSIWEMQLCLSVLDQNRGKDSPFSFLLQIIGEVVLRVFTCPFRLLLGKSGPPWPHATCRKSSMRHSCGEREFLIDNLLIQLHFIIVIIKWTDLAPWEFECSFLGNLTSTFLVLIILITISGVPPTDTLSDNLLQQKFQVSAFPTTFNKTPYLYFGSNMYEEFFIDTKCLCTGLHVTARLHSETLIPPCLHPHRGFA